MCGFGREIVLSGAGHREGHTLPDSALAAGRLKDAVLEELERLLESPDFKGSRRGQVLLRYVVEHALRGDLERLKERTIGIEVFAREVGYDTGQDAIVRVAANDVRKRLAEHYERDQNGHAPPAVRIALSPGSYVPLFQVAETHQAQTVPKLADSGRAPTVSVSPVERMRPSRKLAFAVAAGLLLVFAGSFLALALRRKDAVDEIWSPVLGSRKRVLICVAQPLAYRLPNQPPADHFETAAPPPASIAPNLPSLAADRPIPMPEAYVGVGDAFALAEISSFLTSRGIPWQRRAGIDASSADLRENPVVLIGAFSNPWTRKLTRDLRFVFGYGPHIRDSAPNGKQWALPNLTPDWKTGEDYAIVSRFASGATGEPVIVVAGLTNYGTQAAAEFITNPRLFADAVSQLPPGWQKKNLQFVLHSMIVGKTPGPARLVASHVW